MQEATDHVTPQGVKTLDRPLKNLGIPRENSLSGTWVHRFVIWYPFLHRPSQKCPRVLALLLHGKVGIRSRTTLDPEMSNQTGIGVAHDKLSKHIDAVIYVRIFSRWGLEIRGNRAYLCVFVEHAVDCRRLPHLASPYCRGLLTVTPLSDSFQGRGIRPVQDEDEERTH